MVLAIVLLGVWALMMVPMALVLLMDDDKRRPWKTPVVSIGGRQPDDSYRHVADAA